MAYITAQDLIDLFGEEEIIELSNLDTPNAIVVNFGRVAKAIAWAQEIIDSYASVYYLVPLSGTAGAVPVIIRGYTSDLARYQLDCNRPREDVRIRYEDAIKWLVLLAAGKVSLGDGVKRKASLVLEKPASGPFGVSGYRKPTYTKESFSGFY